MNLRAMLNEWLTWSMEQVSLTTRERRKWTRQVSCHLNLTQQPYIFKQVTSRMKTTSRSHRSSNSIKSCKSKHMGSLLRPANRDYIGFSTRTPSAPQHWPSCWPRSWPLNSWQRFLFQPPTKGRVNQFSSLAAWRTWGTRRSTGTWLEPKLRSTLSTRQSSASTPTKMNFKLNGKTWWSPLWDSLAPSSHSSNYVRVRAVAKIVQSHIQQLEKILTP